MGWSSTTEKVLLEALLAEDIRGKRSDSSWKKEAWTVVAQKVNAARASEGLAREVTADQCRTKLEAVSSSSLLL